MLTIALTGGIASGKTAVSDAFSNLGIPVVDADVVSREVVEPGENALEELVEQFGHSILNNDGSLNRSALRAIIFRDKDSKLLVESVLHPAIRERSDKHKEKFKNAGAPYLIHVIPLLLETDQVDCFDRVLVVDVPVAVQVSRVMTRDSVSREEALAIINSQASRNDRLAIADDIIENTGSLEKISSQVNELHAKYTALSNRPMKTENKE